MCRGPISVRIIRPRVEEILELIRDRLREHGHATHAGSRIVMTGGASQLTGLPEAARRHLAGASTHRASPRCSQSA